MKILLYGFEPFHIWKDNVSQDLIRSLRSRSGFKKVVLPVRFQAAQFLKLIDEFSPDVIVGSGMTSERRRKICIERKAVNLKAARARGIEKPVRQIVSQGPEEYFSTLKIEKTDAATVSYDAGHYVCNFSMYVILHHLRNSTQRFSFLHVPRGYDLSRANSYFEELLVRIRKSV